MGQILLCWWLHGGHLTWTFDLRSKDVFVSLLFDHDDATYISDDINTGRIVNDRGVAHVSARSSSIEDKASQGRSQESASSSHAGENAKSWCQEGKLQHLNLWNDVKSGTGEWWLNSPAWKRWRQAMPRGRFQTWCRRLCKTRSCSRRSSGRDRRLPKREQGRSWRGRQLLDDPWQLQTQSCRRCWRTQSTIWEEQTHSWTGPSAEWSGHRH